MPFTGAEVKDRWDEVTEFNQEAEYPTGSEETFPKFTENLERIEAKVPASRKK